MSNDAFIFDIETAPLPDDQLDQFAPSRDPFDFAAVKTGNLKDQAKIVAKVASAEKAHEAAEDAKQDEWRKRCTLDAKTSRVLAIGMWQGDEYCIAVDSERNGIDCERQTLLTFWQELSKALEKGRRVYGWNILGFDFPFVIQRSVINQVRIPVNIDIPLWRNHWIRDLQDIWTGGKGYCKLDLCARAMGIEGKQDLSGKLPHEIFAEDREAFLDYLKQDVIICKEIQERVASVWLNQ